VCSKGAGCSPLALNYEVQQILELWNFYPRCIPNYTEIVASITDHFRGNDKDFRFRQAEEAVLVKIIILFTSGHMPIVRHL
jgi:hypothetical protein